MFLRSVGRDFHHVLKRSPAHLKTYWISNSKSRIAFPQIFVPPPNLFKTSKNVAMDKILDIWCSEEMSWKCDFDVKSLDSHTCSTSGSQTNVSVCKFPIMHAINYYYYCIGRMDLSILYTIFLCLEAQAFLLFQAPLDIDVMWSWGTTRAWGSNISTTAQFALQVIPVSYHHDVSGMVP